MWMQPETNNNNALRSLKSVVRICHDCNYHVPRPILAKLINSIWRRRRRSAARKHLLLNEASSLRLPPPLFLLSSRSCRTSVDQLAGVANKLYPLSFYLLPANQKLLIRICGVKVYSWLWHFPFRFHCTPGKLNALRSGEYSQLGNAGLKLSRKKKPKGLIARSNLEDKAIT